MARSYRLTKMPSGDYRFLLTDDGDDSERRSFDSLLGKKFYDSTVMTVTNLMRPNVSPEFFMQHVIDANPGWAWNELAPRVWLLEKVK